MLKYNICHIDHKNYDNQKTHLYVPNFDYKFFKTANKTNKILKVFEFPKVLVLDCINNHLFTVVSRSRVKTWDPIITGLIET